jgi:hypothetical protein
MTGIDQCLLQFAWAFRKWNTIGRICAAAKPKATENNTPAAGRVFWAYGPGRSEITILGFEPHPEDKKKAGYTKVKLSNLPPLF